MGRASDAEECASPWCSGTQDAFRQNMGVLGRAGGGGGGGGGATGAGKEGGDPAGAAAEVHMASDGHPADPAKLGRRTWYFLHAVAEGYPLRPSPADRADMLAFLTSFGRVYPCSYCAADFREHLATHPPGVDDRYHLVRWMCEAHNAVNLKLDKPVANCEDLAAKWKLASARAARDAAPAARGTMHISVNST